MISVAHPVKLRLEPKRGKPHGSVLGLVLGFVLLWSQALALAHQHELTSDTTGKSTPCEFCLAHCSLDLPPPIVCAPGDMGVICHGYEAPRYHHSGVFTDSHPTRAPPLSGLCL